MDTFNSISIRIDTAYRKYENTYNFIICIYQLVKQYAEEKFSATSLSATNIRNENTKSRVKKDFRELYPNTPIRFGKLLPA